MVIISSPGKVLVVTKWGIMLLSCNGTSNMTGEGVSDGGCLTLGIETRMDGGCLVTAP